MYVEYGYILYYVNIYKICFQGLFFCNEVKENFKKKN